MLKFLVGFLVAANLVMLASNAGGLGAGGKDGHEPNRAATQLNSQRIVLIDPAPNGATAGSPAGQPGAATATAAVPEVAASVPGSVAAAGAPADAALQCAEIGNFDTAEATRFENLISPVVSGDRLTRRSVQEIERYIVYIPSLGDKESADRKAAELRRIGVDDFFVFNENTDLRFGISLGLFKTAEAANQHLTTLTRKGVRSARVAARVGANSKTAFQLRGLDPQGQAALTRIQASFPRQETRGCSPT